MEIPEPEDGVKLVGKANRLNIFYSIKSGPTREYLIPALFFGHKPTFSLDIPAEDVTFPLYFVRDPRGLEVTVDGLEWRDLTGPRESEKQKCSLKGRFWGLQGSVPDSPVYWGSYEAEYDTATRTGVMELNINWHADNPA